MRTSHRNANVTLLEAFLGGLSFTLPIWILFSTQRLHYSVTLATALFMTVWVTSGVMEVPTGALADRFGRKRMFIIGASLLALYPLAYIFELPIVWIFVFAAVSGFGSALQSGSLLGITHESYREDKRLDEYHTFLSTQLMTTFTARALSGVTGGMLYAIEPRLPYVAVFITSLVSVFIGLFAIDTSTVRSTLSNGAHMKETIRSLLHIRTVWILFIGYTILSLVAEAIWTAYQPIFNMDGFSSEYIGIIFSTIAIFSAFGSYMTRVLMKRIGILHMQVLYGVGTFLTAMLLLVPNRVIHVAAVIPMGIVSGMILPPLYASVQKYMKGQFQTTAVSIVSVFGLVVYAVAALYISRIIDILGINATRKLLFVEGIIAIVLIVIFYISNKEYDEIISEPVDAVSETPISVDIG